MIDLKNIPIVLSPYGEQANINSIIIDSLKENIKDTEYTLEDANYLNNIPLNITTLTINN